MDSGDGGGREEEERKNRKKRGETQRRERERERECVTDTTARHLLLGLLLVASVDRQTSPPANITSAKSNQNSSQIPSELKAAAGESINAELSTAQAWQIFNELENIDEAETLTLANFMQALMDHTPLPTAFADLNSPEAQEASALPVLSVDSIKVVTDGSDAAKKSDQNYELVDGSPAAALDLMNLYQRGGKLAYSSLQNLLKRSYRSLIKLPNVNYVDLTASTKLNVVGDIHGQTDDLFYIIETAGWPSATNKFLFNGDFVDRGQNGVEVLTLLLALQTAFPESVFLNRGNHECRAICAVYGFQQECEEKYDRVIYDQYCELFRHLPIASVVNGSVFVVHGGLFHRANVKLSDLDTIERDKYEGDLEDPQSPENANDPRGYDLRSIMLEALWSDPNPDPQHKVSQNPRGAGVSFGASDTSTFLKVNKLSMVVRSHECVKDGVAWPFQGLKYSDKLCTLFSASNYEGRGNKAAYLVFQEQNSPLARTINGSTLKLIVNTFTTSECDDGLARSEGKHLLRDLICKRSKALTLNFTAADSENTGVVSKEVWADVMRAVTKVNISWLPMAGAIIPPAARRGDGVLYSTFLDSFRKGADDSANADGFYAEKRKLEAIFRFFDTDRNGSISREEFKEGCAVINKILPPERQLKDPDVIMSMMDFDGSDSIDMNEFFETFRILDAKDGVVDGVISMATNREDRK